MNTDRLIAGLVVGGISGLGWFVAKRRAHLVPPEDPARQPHYRIAVGLQDGMDIAIRGGFVLAVVTVLASLLLE